MRIKFVNAFIGREEYGKDFFKDYGKLALCDIRIAQATGGSKAVAKVLENDNFLGKVKEVKEYVEPVANGLKERVSYIVFTKPVTTKKERYSEDTGEYIETKEVTEDYTYYLEVRSFIE